ncbi:hypothetical protein [Roseomonas marmotae]|nr:hypothetical protein [Roseomonas marmotae]
MDTPTKKPEPLSEETPEERLQRLERQRVRPEDEERRSPGGPASQISPDVEPAGS